jgi:hypothetical protein
MTVDGIRWSRVFLGGLAAGFVINVFFVGPALGAVHVSVGKATPAGTVMAVILVGLVFVLSFLVTWLYATLRLRFGPGRRTAAIAGLASGLVLGVFEFIGWLLTSKLIPARLLVIIALITSVSVVITSLLGAWVYEKPST